MPSLSELSAVYNQRPYAPGQDVQARMDRAMADLPRLDEMRRHQQAQEEEKRRQNAPVSPWQKAIMRIMAGHDVKEVAADTKTEIGSSDNAGPPVQNLGQNAPPSYGPSTLGAASAQMPQVTVSRGDNTQPQGLGWQGRGGMSEDTFSGMTNRDFDSFVNAMGTANKSRQDRTTADLMEIERERTRRALAVEDKRGTSKENVADIAATSRKEIDDAREAHKKDVLAFQKEKEKHLSDYRKQYLDVIRNKAEYYREIGKSKVGQDPNVKAALEKYKSATSVYKGIASQPLNNLTDEGRKVEDEARAKAEEAEKELTDALKNAKPQMSEQQHEREGEKGVMRKYKNKQTGAVISGTPAQLSKARNPQDWEEVKE